MSSTTNLGWSLADSCALTIASYVFVAQAEQPQQGPSPMIHRVGQDYDRCPSEVIMCGRTLAAGHFGVHRWLARDGSNPRGLRSPSGQTQPDR